MQRLLESFVIQFTTVSSGGVAIQEVYAFSFQWDPRVSNLILFYIGIFLYIILFQSWLYYF